MQHLRRLKQLRTLHQAPHESRKIQDHVKDFIKHDQEFGFLRLVVADPLFYFLGLFYGDAAIRWIERKAGDGATLIIWFEKAFHKARYPIVLIAPNNPVCLLAGATGMRKQDLIFKILKRGEGADVARVVLRAGRPVKRTPRCG